MTNNALLIFTRNPELGKVKTRLAKTIGNEKALLVYRDLLLHTMTETQKVACDKFVYYDQNIEQNDIWSNSIFKKRQQSGSDLGSKMLNAFQDLFNQGYDNCIIIGSDLFDLKAEHLIEAFEKLEENDAVIGPAEDGGYYLLGSKKLIPALFSNKNWGTETVLAATLKDLTDFSVAVLAILNDIDTVEDLEKSYYYKHYKSL